MSARIAVVPGDGIGLEVIREAVRVLEAAAGRFDLDLTLTHFDLGADLYLARGVAITEEEFDVLADHDAILLGALGDERVPGNEHMREILLGLRFGLDLFINYRPCRVLDPRLSPLASAADHSIDLHIFRENTEGIYSGIGGRHRVGTPDEIAIQEDVNTRRAVERIVRAACEFTRDRGLGLLTMVDKANAMPDVGGLWRDVFAEVTTDYEGFETEVRLVDAMAMDLVRRPERYRVLVTGNLFGDILSDLAAQVAGGLGAAPSANLHPGRHALFEPVHGSAPDIAGEGIANPLGAIACAGLALDHVGSPDAARAVDDAIESCVVEGPRTADFGGEASTEEVGEWIAERVSA
jgi:3-isopropylmalate dehydrogenase